MKCVVQRVTRARVTIDNVVAGAIDHGLLVLIGITHSDTPTEVEWMADKLLSLRVFADVDNKMNLSVSDVAGGILLVSQFTLYGQLSKGTRPSYINAARPEQAEPMYNHLVTMIKTKAPNLTVATGVFGAMMNVELVNDGPVTIILDRDAQ